MSNRLGIHERFKINIKLERLIVEKAFKSFAQLLLVYLFLCVCIIELEEFYIGSESKSLVRYKT